VDKSKVETSAAMACSTPTR